MKGLGYGKDYKYPHDYEDAFVLQEYLPDELRDMRFYRPRDSGFEKELAKRLEAYLARRDAERKKPR
jgi:putative ATPase